MLTSSRLGSSVDRSPIVLEALAPAASSVTILSAPSATWRRSNLLRAARGNPIEPMADVSSACYASKGRRNTGSVSLVGHLCDANVWKFSTTSSPVIRSFFDRSNRPWIESVDDIRDEKPFSWAGDGIFSSWETSDSILVNQIYSYLESGN